jgi:hypothetical protein
MTKNYKQKGYRIGRKTNSLKKSNAKPQNKIAECLGYEDINIGEYTKIYNDLAIKFHDVIQTYQNLPSKKHKALYLDGMLGHIFTNFYDDVEFKFTTDEIAVCAVDAMKATEWLIQKRDNGTLPSQGAVH